jgi:hypothetical protein
LVNKRAIEPHIPVFDKSARTDGTFSREHFAYDHQSDSYICPAGKVLTSTGTLVNDGTALLYPASELDCDTCQLMHPKPYDPNLIFLRQHRVVFRLFRCTDFNGRLDALFPSGKKSR